MMKILVTEQLEESWIFPQFYVEVIQLQGAFTGVVVENLKSKDLIRLLCQGESISFGPFRLYTV